jgi:lipopolysaccharide assembly protein A
MRAFSVLFLMALLALVGILAVQNQQEIGLTFLEWTITPSVAVLVGVTYLLGMVTGGAVVGMIRRSLHQLTEEPHRDYAHAR